MSNITVWLLHVTFKKNSFYGVYASENQAKKALVSIATNYWHLYKSASLIPNDDQELIDIFYNDFDCAWYHLDEAEIEDAKELFTKIGEQKVYVLCIDTDGDTYVSVFSSYELAEQSLCLFVKNRWSRCFSEPIPEDDDEAIDRFLTSGAASYYIYEEPVMDMAYDQHS